MEIDNPAVEEVVLRGLAKDREDRFPDVAAFTSALVEAVGEPVDETPAAWIPADPDLTRAAASTEATGVASDQPPPASRGRRHRRWPWVAAAVLALTMGTGAGWALERNGASERELEDSTGTIFVTVPESWTGQVDPEQWVPFEGRAEQASLAAGTHRGGTPTTTRRGRLRRRPARRPAAVPRAGPPRVLGPARPLLRREQDGDDIMTVFFSGCPGVDVTVERVIRRQPEPAALDPDPRRRPRRPPTGCSTR